MATNTKPQESPNTPVKYVRERDEYKVVIVSTETHARLKEFAQKTGYKLQYVADVAIAEFLKRQEVK
jgi:bifunctional DNA-binding transcriptional regulator/antitoxin component of YhaV-PrlF toxin-antitoxin module